MKTKPSDRLKYYCYRCYRCGRLLTRLGIVATWEKAESDPSGVHMPICPCGSRHLSPANPKLWEELFLPRVWKEWFYEVLVPWVRAKLRSPRCTGGAGK